MELGGEALVIPDLQVVVVPEHIDIAGSCPQNRAVGSWMTTRPCVSNLGGLAEIVHAIEILEAGRYGSWGFVESFSWMGHPDGHGVDAGGHSPVQARHEQLSSGGLLDKGTEGVRDLEPPLVINSGGVDCPGARPFTPLCSTKIHRDSRERGPD